MRRRSRAILALSVVTLLGGAGFVGKARIARLGESDRSTMSANGSHATGGDASRTVPTIGLIGPDDAQLVALADSSLTQVVVLASWSAIEPRPATFDQAALRRVFDRVAHANQLGFGVILDLGLQYPPAWAFELPGATRFVNQYGDTWSGPVSEDVPDAVFNLEVRRAQSRYIEQLGSALRGAGVLGVRIGGLLSGELRYPSSSYAGHRDSLWAFGADALADSPDPSWRPGAGSEESARAVLTWYCSMLTDYLRFQLDAVAAGFPDIAQQVLMPSWGLRPGMLDQAVRTRFGPDTPPDVADIVAAGLDWVSQVDLIASRPGTVVPYTTWLDAPDYGTTARREAPVSYLASLVASTHLSLGGENTGGDGMSALSRTLTQARRFNLTTVMFMSGGFITRGQAGLSLNDLEGAVAGFLR